MLTVFEHKDFSLWFRKLDESPKARVLARIRRVRDDGNLGDWKSVGDGVNEMRLDFGSGYRLYFARDGKTVVVLLAGGDKRTQTVDIRRAKANWQDFTKG